MATASELAEANLSAMLGTVVVGRGGRKGL